MLSQDVKFTIVGRWWHCLGHGTAGLHCPFSDCSDCQGLKRAVLAPDVPFSFPNQVRDVTIVSRSLESEGGILCDIIRALSHSQRNIAGLL